MKKYVILWATLIAVFYSSLYPLPQIQTFFNKEQVKRQFKKLKNTLEEQVDQVKKCLTQQNCSRQAIIALTGTALALIVLFAGSRRLLRKKPGQPGEQKTQKQSSDTPLIKPGKEEIEEEEEMKEEEEGLMNEALELLQKIAELKAPLLLGVSQESGKKLNEFEQYIKRNDIDDLERLPLTPESIAHLRNLLKILQ